MKNKTMIALIVLAIVLVAFIGWIIYKDLSMIETVELKPIVLTI